MNTKYKLHFQAYQKLYSTATAIMFCSLTVLQ